MASPIRWFRKHSQFFIVIFGVLLMAIFGLGSIISGYGPRQGGGRSSTDDKVVAQWSGGTLKRSDIETMRYKHFAGIRLIAGLEQYAINRNGGEPVPVSVQRIPPIGRPDQRENVTQLNDEVLNRFLFAKRAEQEGFIVDEETVFDYIAQFGGDVPVTKTLLKQINREVNTNIPLMAVVGHLQQELLWMQMEGLTRGGLPFDPVNQISMSAINPTEAIQLFAKSNRRIECQVLPLSVQEYVSKVTDEPNESDLRALYEQGKYEFPSSNFDRPGFKTLDKANIQYFVGEMESFLQNEMAKVTDEEVQAEYDRLVAAEDPLVMETVPQKPQQETDKDPQTTDDDIEMDAPAEDADPAPAPKADDAVPLEEGDINDQEINDAATEPMDEVDQQDQDSSGDEGADDEPEAEPDDADDDGLQMELYTSLTEDQEGENSSQQESDDESGAENDTATDEPSSGDPTANAGAAVQTDSEGDNDEATAESGSVQDDADPVMADEPKKERRPKPLKDVAEDIKRRMKMEAARIARDAAMNAAEKQLRGYQMELSQWDFKKQEDAKAAEPSPPDFSKIADEQKILFLETGLIDQTQIGDQRIGQVATFDVVNRRINNVGEDIFRNYSALQLYEPATADDFSTNSKVIYWLSQKVDQDVPSFEDAREAVLVYWKLQRGVELAQQEAEKIAEQINGSDKTLKDLFPELAQETGVFSWFTAFGQFSYGSPASVEDAGEDFMETAFSLGDREASIALNDTREIVYVIQQITQFSMPLEKIGDDYIEKNFFLTSRVPQEVVSAKTVYLRRMNYEWLKEFQKTLDVKIMGD